MSGAAPAEPLAEAPKEHEKEVELESSEVGEGNSQSSEPMDEGLKQGQ